MAPDQDTSSADDPSRWSNVGRSGADRALTPLVGVVVLVAVTALGGAMLAAGLSGADVLSQADSPAPQVVLEARANASADRVSLIHRGGDALDVEDLRLHVAVAGTPLAHQPPVPFFAAEGFESGPTGPFNVGGNTRWTAGEVASFAIAGTNEPQLDSGARVTVRVYSDGSPVAELRTTA